MGKIWTILMASSLAALLIASPGTAVTAMTKGSLDAVNLAIRLCALYALWLGFFSILEKTGISNRLAKLLRPVVKFLFPGSSAETSKFITMNMSANMLGLGNAATPMAIRAIKSMDVGSAKASINMIMLIVISSTSLQLLPSTVIGMRAAHGSVNPADFIVAGIIATVVSTMVGICLVKGYAGIVKKVNEKRKTKNKKRLSFSTRNTTSNND
ncbi:MAG: spore maturation protein [Firmicutes bacterium]|nr:spore maturation protein [Bacillota bacterium]